MLNFFSAAVRHIAIALFARSLVGCETIKGIGRDIENAGEALDEALD